MFAFQPQTGYNRPARPQDVVSIIRSVAGVSNHYTDRVISFSTTVYDQTNGTATGAFPLKQVKTYPAQTSKAPENYETAL